MKKIILTENQLNMIKNQILEKSNIDERYHRNVSVYVETYGVKINGVAIDWAEASRMDVSFLVDMDHRKWGIKDVYIYSIQGPSEIEITITPQIDDAEDIEITLPLNWDDIDTETESNMGLITVGDEITLTLGNDENGNLIVQKINVPVYNL